MTDSNAIPVNKKSSRIVELDVLRAIAALNLLLFHFTWVYSSKYGFDSPLGVMFPFGKYGVQLFFMLSGFVNLFALLRKKPTSADFAVGRAIRIVPSFWLIVLFNVVLLSMFPMLQQDVTVGGTLANLTIMPQLFGAECMEPVTWTLMVEVLFYGFLLYLLRSKRLYQPLMSTMMFVLAMCVIGGLGNQFIQQHYSGTTFGECFAFVDRLCFFRWMPLFSIGILLHEIKIKRGTFSHNSLGIFASAVAFHVIDQKHHNPVVTVILLALLGLSAFGKLPVLRLKPLVFIGSISYSLYLFHNNLGTALIHWMETIGVNSIVAFTIGTLAMIALSALITYRFEQPASKLLRSQWAKFKQRPLVAKTIKAIA